MFTFINRLLTKSIIGIGIAVISLIILNSIVSPTLSHIASYWRSNTVIGEVRLQNLLALVIAITILIIFTVLSRKILIKDKVSNLTASVLCIGFFIFFLWQFHYLQIDSFIDDSYLVHNAAQEFVETGELSGWYMVSNPQNLFMMFIYIFISKLTSSFDIWSIYFAFSILHVATSALIYTSAKKLSNKNVPSLIAMIIFIFTFQINMHVAIMYTDILSMFFLMIGIYLFISFSKTPNQHFKLLYLLFASLFFSIAFLSKGLYLILFIALFLGMLISLKGKEKIYALLPVFVFFFINIGWNNFIVSQNMFEKEEIGMPNTHYIFMGSNTDYYFQNEDNKEYRLAGAYNEEDVNFTKDLFWVKGIEKDQITSIHLDKIKERLTGISRFKLIEFLWAKISNTWSSGDLKSTVSVGMASSTANGLKNLRESRYLYTFLQTVQYIYYLIFLLVFLKIFIFLPKNAFLYISTFFVIGMFFFLLMWEASPRYSMTVMPFAPVIFSYFLVNNFEIKRGKTTLEF
ncbi:ArnT family glycosyltransferase [Marinilactibacillus psychrotolerans]|uniref:Phospholipid carrier-dependent glycosyltransferase n=1 Tax=Marinilactibacillus psychrotolerans TaxID=191770 RepID=A0A5R9C0T8_9LACT|nr:glycosyltransferase family 39 protein [Marinilactibacillus psychrotolerans]TLQ06274.1 phospholipid carrier-dependent glycosyltransferase [Marinilactibacillus psychrotolerans]